MGTNRKKENHHTEMNFINTNWTEMQNPRSHGNTKMIIQFIRLISVGHNDYEYHSIKNKSVLLLRSLQLT